MAVKRPLVLYNGVREELRTSDTLSTKKPLVLYGGVIEELRAGDSLATKKALVLYNGIIEQIRSGDTVAGTVNTTPFVTGLSSTGAVRNDFTGRVGFRFTVSGADRVITDLGRLVLSGNSQSHTIYLRNSSGTTLASTVVNLLGATVGSYVYGSITPITLTAGVAYWIYSDETNGGDTWYDVSGTSLQTTNIATVQSGAYEFNGANNNTGGAGSGYVVPNFKYQI